MNFIRYKYEFFDAVVNHFFLVNFQVNFSNTFSDCFFWLFCTEMCFQNLACGLEYFIQIGTLQLFGRGQKIKLVDLKKGRQNV